MPYADDDKDAASVLACETIFLENAVELLLTAE
jgi:hypothetical protein